VLFLMPQADCPFSGTLQNLCSIVPARLIATGSHARQARCRARAKLPPSFPAFCNLTRFNGCVKELMNKPRWRTELAFVSYTPPMQQSRLHSSTSRPRPQMFEEEPITDAATLLASALLPSTDLRAARCRRGPMMLA
jgi:hypothetical protein